MTDRPISNEPSATVVLTVQRVIRATPERLFDAWTTPEQLRKWWGPASVTCVGAEVDLKVGGRYRIANQFPDGNILWITGVFEAIEKPAKLIYTWQIGSDASAERVTVRFEAQGEDTKVIVIHERIPNLGIRDRHEQGWFGCLDGLAALLDHATAPDQMKNRSPN